MPRTPAVPMSAAPDTDAGVLSGPDIAGRVVRGGALRAVGFGVVNLLGVVSSVVLLRHLGVADFGRYGTVIALVAIASGLADAGLNMTGSRELALLPRGPERRRLLGALLGVRLLLLTLAVLAAVAFAVLAGYDSAMLAGTALAGAGAVLVGMQSTLTLPLVVELRNGLVTLNEVLKQVILVVGVVALAVAGAALTPFFAVQLLVGAGALLAVPLLVDRAQLAWPSFSREDLRRLAVTALPVALASIVTAFYVRMLIVHRVAADLGLRDGAVRHVGPHHGDDRRRRAADGGRDPAGRHGGRPRRPRRGCATCSPTRPSWRSSAAA